MSCMDEQASLASILSDDEETMISQVCQIFRNVAFTITLTSITEFRGKIDLNSCED